MTDSSAGEPLHDGGPLVITLCSTSVPMMLQLPLLSVFAGLTVFRSRAIEEGRERFRMHLGYFYDLERAEKVLVAARRFYPGAFLTEAPQGGMGSLDDTMNAAFQFAKGPATRLVPAERIPTPDELQAVADPRPTDVEPVYDDHTGAVAEAAAADTTPMPEPVTEPVTELVPEQATEPGVPAAAYEIPSIPNEIALDPATPMLDVAPPALAAIAEMSSAPDASARARDRGVSVQRYAVQLRWSLRPTDPQSIPHHALFRQFTLYGVTVQRGDASEHGLRLGFFSNLYSAKQVADYVRHDFPLASVVPVSERELVRAQQAAWNELLARVGVARGAPATDADGARRPLRRDGGLRRLWGRQR